MGRSNPFGRSGLGRFAGLVAAAVIGGGVVAGTLVATGSVSTSHAATSVVEAVPAVASPLSRAAPSSMSTSAIYARAAPGVVDVTARSAGQSSGGVGSGFGFPFGAPFGGGGQQTVASGSGFVVDGRGHIVTAAHVVDGARSITVRFAGGASRAAKLVGEDRSTDVAVLAVDPSGLALHPLALGTSRPLAVGDPVVAIGDPFGYDRSLSAGVVSGLGRSIQAPNGFSIPDAVQTDAALNPGNSGAPLVDAQGQVVGVADQIVTDQQGPEADSGSSTSSGVGFAVPIDVAASAVSGLEHGGHVQHAYLGVAAASGNAAGAVVEQVQPASPAAAAGLRPGDVIVGVDGKPVTGPNGLVDVVVSDRPGDKITLGVRRGSARLTLTATLATQPSGAPTAQ